MDEVCTVVDNLIDDYPNTTVLLVRARPLGPYHIWRDERESIIRDGHVLQRVLIIEDWGSRRQ